ncbi:MAG: chemotaxis protein CheA [candidate division WOR-3 bacterium]
MAELEFFDDFIVEVTEILEGLDNDFVELEARPDDLELLNKIFRAVHTMKGTSSFMGFSKMMGITHVLEDILNLLRSGKGKVKPDIMDVMLEALDKIKEIVNYLKDNKTEPDINIDDIIEKLKATYNALKEGRDFKDEFASVQKGEIVQDVDVIGGDKPLSREELEAFEKEIEEMLKKELEKEKQVADEVKDTGKKLDEKKEKEEKRETTIRVDITRLDALMNLVGELVLGRNRLLSIVQKLYQKYDQDELVQLLVETMDQVDFITTDLQLAVMKTRMVPIGRVFGRFPRVVRDLARELKKEVNLVIEGEETELDRSIVDEIYDPLVHLIRNAVDHGIEYPEEREIIGKPRAGLLRLSAYHEGNQIVIVVEDDGRGIDIDKVKRKALEKGLVTSEEVSRMSDSDVMNLIFMPGFSTSEKVSSVSGRGVGMDVVRVCVEKLGGTIELKSERNKGTKVILKIPLTLAIIQSLLVQVSDEIYAIPIVSVVEAVKLKEGDIKTVENREVMVLRDMVLPLIRLRNLFDIPGESSRDKYAVVLAIGEKKFGLLVEKLIGQEEVVIKSLGSYLGTIEGIAGATIMGDGRVTLILDVAGIANLAVHSVY